ncbi:MAG: hypothetical protein J7463_10270 [Roseiflexus sp.]|nr:hypothetical protein [Roseiflexus sp.]MBO9335228.1 hypothetical protein [Roseiflexus sp.]MBO9341122.1 hypothetical protein [Roseiflexus sp.]MBO9365927.1 hypothetical protein [Roseiflexus sp.]MBO9383986.1 hypothetical protein [Roseiflexus sp.]
MKCPIRSGARCTPKFMQTTLFPLRVPVTLCGLLLLLYGLNFPVALWARVPGSSFLAGV